MLPLQKLKEFINDLGSSINELTTFSSQSAQGDPNQQGQLAREERRRSSWHDLGSYFRIPGKETHPPTGPEGAAAIEGVDKSQSTKTSNGPDASVSGGVIQNRNASGRGASSGSGPGKSSLGRTASAGSADMRMRQMSSQSRGVDVNSLRNGQPRYNSSRNGPSRSTSRTVAGSAPSSLSLPGASTSRTVTSVVIDSRSPSTGSAFSRVQSSSQVGGHHQSQSGLTTQGAHSHASHASLSSTQSSGPHGFPNSPKLGGGGHTSHSTLGGHSQSSSTHSSMTGHSSSSAIPHTGSAGHTQTSGTHPGGLSATHGSALGNRGISGSTNHSSTSAGGTYNSGHGLSIGGPRSASHAQSSPNLSQHTTGPNTHSHAPMNHSAPSSNASYPSIVNHPSYSMTNQSISSGSAQYSVSGSYAGMNNQSVPVTGSHSSTSSNLSLGSYSGHHPSAGNPGYMGISSSSMPSVCSQLNHTNHSSVTGSTGFSNQGSSGSHSSYSKNTANTTVTIIGTTPQSSTYTHASSYGNPLSSGPAVAYSSTSSLPSQSISSQGHATTFQPNQNFVGGVGPRYTPPRASMYESSPVDQRYIDRSRSVGVNVRSGGSSQQGNTVMDGRLESQREQARGGRGHYAEDEMEILNGRQTQQYYDHMIAQINEQIARAVDRGQSPYAIYAMDEDEENDWC